MKETVFTLFLSAVICLGASAQEKTFEGEIVYKNTVTADKTTQKFYSWARNGVYEVRFFMNGKNRLEENDYTDIKTLITKDNDMCYIWSDLTKTGYCYKYSDYLAFLKKLKADYTQTELNSINETGETSSFFGYECKQYKGEIKEKVNWQLVKLEQTYKKNYWICMDLPNIIDEEDFPGMAFKYEFNVSGKVPLLGSFQNYQSCEIVSITPKTINEEIFDIPDDVEFDVTADGDKAIRKLAKEVRKYKKKHKIENSKVKTNESSEEGSFDF